MRYKGLEKPRPSVFVYRRAPQSRPNGQCAHRLAALAASGSSSGEILTAPVDVLTFRSHATYPLFVSRIVWSPGETPTDEGVLPTKLPSNSISAPGGAVEIS